jgi:hypothetical protein
MDPFMIAKLIELGLNAVCRITQVWRNEDGSFDVISFAKGTHTMSQATVAAMDAYLKANPVPVPPAAPVPQAAPIPQAPPTQ